MNPGTGNMKSRLVIIVLACLAFPITGVATEHDPGAWITFSTTDVFQTEQHCH
jgi:hypothetical protein